VLAYSGIYVFDIASPEAPALIGHYGQVSSPWGLAASGSTVALADSLQGLVLLRSPLPPLVWLPAVRR
jgi:hypothetical protein